ncbi:MAG: hypothetical protein U1E38_02190 [Rhodospirillales bacterium]
MTARPVTEDELQAYVDDALEEGGAARSFPTSPTMSMSPTVSRRIGRSGN